MHTRASPRFSPDLYTCREDDTPRVYSPVLGPRLPQLFLSPAYAIAPHLTMFAAPARRHNEAKNLAFVSRNPPPRPLSRFSILFPPPLPGCDTTRLPAAGPGAAATPRGRSTGGSGSGSRSRSSSSSGSRRGSGVPRPRAGTLPGRAIAGGLGGPAPHEAHPPPRAQAGGSQPRRQQPAGRRGRGRGGGEGGGGFRGEGRRRVVGAAAGGGGLPDSSRGTGPAGRGRRCWEVRRPGAGGGRQWRCAVLFRGRRGVSRRPRWLVRRERCGLVVAVVVVVVVVVVLSLLCVLLFVVVVRRLPCRHQALLSVRGSTVGREFPLLLSLSHLILFDEKPWLWGLLQKLKSLKRGDVLAVGLFSLQALLANNIDGFFRERFCIIGGRVIRFALATSSLPLPPCPLLPAPLNALSISLSVSLSLSLSLECMLHVRLISSLLVVIVHETGPLLRRRPHRCLGHPEPPS